MTDLQKLVQQWVREAKTPKYMHDTSGGRKALSDLCLLAMQYAFEQSAILAEEQANQERDSYWHDGCMSVAQTIRERAKEWK